jgi:hypothetical protein
MQITICKHNIYDSDKFPESSIYNQARHTYKMAKYMLNSTKQIISAICLQIALSHGQLSTHLLNYSLQIYRLVHHKIKENPTLEFRMFILNFKIFVQIVLKHCLMKIYSLFFSLILSLIFTQPFFH